MNGNRLNEHRKSKVPGSAPAGIQPGLQWTVLLVLLGLLLFLCKLAEGQEYQTYNEGTGLIIQQSELCFANEINADTINLLKTWQAAVDGLESFERGGPPMDKELAALGQLLYDNHMCATVKDSYFVIILRRQDGYALLKFDEQYDFDAPPFIVAARDVLPDRGI